MSCDRLKTEDLVAHLDGELSAGESARVRDHLSGCVACARDAALLGEAGDLVAALPRHELDAEFADRINRVTAAKSRSSGRVRRLWPVLAATAAAAVLVAAVITRLSGGPPDDGDALLTAAEERDIAADLYVLSNLDALESADAAELISLVNELDLLESLEPEMAGLFDDVQSEPGPSDSGPRDSGPRDSGPPDSGLGEEEGG